MIILLLHTLNVINVVGASYSSITTAPMSMTITYKRKGATKNAEVPKGPSPASLAWAAGRPSIALPFTKAPATLDGSMLGDVGFDPLGFSTAPIGAWFIDEGIGDLGTNLTWLREAELMHGRIAQLAFVGILFPAVVGTLPGNKWTGISAYSNINPLQALHDVPRFALLQIFLFMSVLEFKRLSFIKEEGDMYVPGDLRIGQGLGRWNPFGLSFTPDEYMDNQLKELKHCRLAMIAVLVLWIEIQANEGYLEIDKILSPFFGIIGFIQNTFFK